MMENILMFTEVWGFFTGLAALAILLVGKALFRQMPLRVIVGIALFMAVGPFVSKLFAWMLQLFINPGLLTEASVTSGIKFWVYFATTFMIGFVIWLLGYFSKE